MIQFVTTNAEQIPETSKSDGDREGNFVKDVSALNSVDQKLLSLVSSEVSDSKFEKARSTEQQEATSPLKTQTNTTNDERFVYLTRIEELEKSLQTQQNRSNELQVFLKGKVEELEQTLKIPATSPWGSVVQGSPFKTLLDRNQTLVKEVRFADQTCVELSSKIKELERLNEVLESENTQIRKRAASAEQEKDNLRLQLKILENSHLAPEGNRDVKFDELSRELELTKMNLRSKMITEGNLLELIKDGVGGLGLDLSDLLDGNSSSSISTSFETSSNSTKRIGEGSSSSVLGSTHSLRRLVIVLLKSVKQMHQKCKQPNVNEDVLHPENRAIRPNTIPIQGDLCERCLRRDQLEVASDTTTDSNSQSMEKYPGKKVTTLLHESDFERQQFLLENDIEHLRTTCDTIKRESKDLSNNMIIDDIDTLESSAQTQMLIAIQASFLRMKRRYKLLEVDVETLIESFTGRLEAFANTVTYLRQSLIFEPGSSLLTDEDVQNADMQRWYNTDKVIDATIEETHSRAEDDKIFQSMEEARSPLSTDVEILSSSDNMSSLLADDVTLESATRPGSAISSFAHADKWKELFLEAAISKCQRVRERGARLKEQNDSQKVTIENLEKENGRLSLHASRQGEETHLVEKALKEARNEICTLQEALVLLQKEKEVNDRRSAEQGEERRITNEANERLTTELLEASNEIGLLNEQLVKQKRSIESRVQELVAIMKVSEEYKDRNDDLVLQLTAKEFEMTAKFDMELLDARQSLMRSERELAEQRRLRQETATKLSNETRMKTELEVVVSEMRNSKRQLLSDLEDRDLAFTLEQEDMRKERADLKSKLKETEKDAADLKAQVQSLKEQYQTRSFEKQSFIESLESKNEELLTNINGMMAVRSEFSNLIHSLGCRKPDLFSNFFVKAESSVNENPFAPESEIKLWKDLLPRIGEEISALHQTIANLSEVLVEVEDLKEQLSKLELRESELLDQLKKAKRQNEKLFALLHQAEQEIERSTKQIKEMSKSIVTLQERETETNVKVENAESESLQLRKDLEKTRIQGVEEKDKLKLLLADKRAEFEVMDAQLRDKCVKYETLQANLEKATNQLSLKEAEVDKMKPMMESLEKKNSVLREYIRKLTGKCEEWEESYEKQTVAIEKLQQKNSRIRDKASQIADRYRKLSLDIQCRKRIQVEDRANWRHERTKLNDVHGQLERELEQIANELSFSLQEKEI
jgi:hypothetical protein